MNALRIMLLPLSFVYYAVISVRNFLFAKNIIKREYFNTPIISVGNITAGGTGKTPFVIFLADFLMSKGKSIGVISRGYKSKTNSLVIAYDGKTVSSDVHTSGDELSMIINRFTGNSRFYAIAYRDRVKAIEEMEKRFSPDVIILDDAYQNRRINKTIDIVLTDKEDQSFLNRLLLPAGNLRETSSSLNRADIILNNYKFTKVVPQDTNSIGYIFSGYFNYEGNKMEIPECKKAILISAIANNNSFHNIVKNQGINVQKKYVYIDHYDYTISDIEKYKRDFNDDTVYLTTEKDFVKIKEYKDFVTNYPVYYFRIDVILYKSTLENLLNKKNII